MRDARRNRAQFNADLFQKVQACARCATGLAALVSIACSAAPAPPEPPRIVAIPSTPSAAPSSEASATPESPPPARGPRRVVRIDAFDYTTCVVLEDGHVRCNSHYTPMDVKGVEGAVDVAVGMGFACAATATGSVLCWGNNNQNRVLGTDDIGHDVAEPVAGVTEAVAVGAADEHACALRKDGKVLCWGRNRNGQLGRADRDHAMPPALLEGLADVAALALTYFDTCALKKNGDVYCTSGAPGHYDELTPLSGAKQLSRGRHDLCAVMGDGGVKCWVGKSKAGSSTVTFGGEAVKGLPPSRFVARDEGDEHTCAIAEDGTVRCWVHNLAGELGACTSPKRPFSASDIPVTVAGVAGAVRLVASRNMTCALLGDGTVKCWGQNKFGELANGAAWIWPRAGADTAFFDPPMPPACVSANMRYSGKVSAVARTGGSVVERVEPFGTGSTCVAIDLAARSSKAVDCPADLLPVTAPAEWRTPAGNAVRISTGASDWSATTLEELDANGKKLRALDLPGKAAFAGVIDDTKLVFIVRSSNMNADPPALGNTVIVATSPLRTEGTVEPPLCVMPPERRPNCPR